MDIVNIGGGFYRVDGWDNNGRLYLSLEDPFQADHVIKISNVKDSPHYRRPV